MSRRTLVAFALAIVALLGNLALPRSGAPLALDSAAAAEQQPLTNLAHLDWLGDSVRPPQQDFHTTYRLAEEPSVGVLWTYADLRDGVYQRIGGGPYDATANTYAQGAFNADDLTRAAVLYVRHWKQTGSLASRAHAFELLRGLTYLQTASGPDAGNVVLWMQPDGTLNPSPIPVELPDPSDSDASSYWVARTVWALGEGYAAFRDADPAFAAFLRSRLELSIAALDHQVLDAYGQYLDIDGERTPAWLIANGGDATSEALLGLAAYVDAGGSAPARAALRKFAAGVAALGDGDQQTWPFGAVRPWALSRSIWHGWGSQMPAGLARAGQALRDKRLVAPAVRDSSVFTPWLLTSGGFNNGRLPTTIDRSQIAYGADSRLESLLATAEVAGRPGLRALAGVAAAWFFGANPAGVPAYDPATGRTIDGVNSDGSVNRNAGAESTIHGLLAMLALDAHPDVAVIARTAAITAQVGTRTLQAEDAGLSGGAAPVAPESKWTGESEFGGTGYASMPDGGTAMFAVPADLGPALVLPVVDLRPGSSAVTTFTGAGAMGQVASGEIGAQGASPAPGALLPVSLRRSLPAGALSITATTVAQNGDDARLDALMLEPLVSRFVLGGGTHGTALLHSAATSAMTSTVSVPGAGRLVVEVYDRTGSLQARSRAKSSQAAATVRVLPGGFTLVRR